MNWIVSVFILSWSLIEYRFYTELLFEPLSWKTFLGRYLVRPLNPLSFFFQDTRDYFIFFDFFVYFWWRLLGIRVRMQLIIDIKFKWVILKVFVIELLTEHIFDFNLLPLLLDDVDHIDSILFVQSRSDWVPFFIFHLPRILINKCWLWNLDLLGQPCVSCVFLCLPLLYRQLRIFVLELLYYLRIFCILFINLPILQFRSILIFSRIIKLLHYAILHLSWISQASS